MKIAKNKSIKIITLLMALLLLLSACADTDNKQDASESVADTTSTTTSESSASTATTEEAEKKEIFAPISRFWIKTELNIASQIILAKRLSLIFGPAGVDPVKPSCRFCRNIILNRALMRGS